MRTLPENISAHPDGYLVRLQRNRVLFQAFVPKSRADALARAIALRDRFLATAGEKVHAKSCRPHRRGWSNSGIVGISELVTWRRARSYNCFSVSWSDHSQGHTKRFLFGHRGGDTRAEALQAAIHHREQMTGEPVAKSEVLYA